MALVVNMDSILSKAKNYVSSSKGQKEFNQIKSDIIKGVRKPGSGQSVHTPEEAAEKFIEVLRQEIASSGISENAISAINELSASAATEIGEDVYTIKVSFSGDLSRSSLCPDRYDGIQDLAVLLNDGVDHTMNRVYGMWHGNYIGSRTVISGAGFMEAAVNAFMGSYADEYNVTSIVINKGE